MFDIGASELLLIVVVAIVVIGPKDLPLALRTAGRWIARMRRVSNHFRSGIEAMIREAELEEMEKKWQAHNAAIMAQDTANPAAAPAAADAAAPAMEPLPSSAHGELPPEPAPAPEPAQPEAAPVDAKPEGSA